MLTLRAYTGANAGTESAAQTAIYLGNADTLNSGNSVAPGTFSYERWLALRVDSPPVSGVTNFWFQNTGALPSGVTLRFGVTDMPTTPINSQSLVATTELQTDRRYIFDTNTYTEAGDKTRYLVLQLQALITADDGPIEQQTPAIGWSET
jgi:hypothetical protein